MDNPETPPGPPAAPPPISPRQRMQQLLAIPERQRTDAQWDELNELEIQLASANRLGAPDPSARRDGQSRGGGGGGGGGGGQQRSGGGGQQGKRPFRKFHKGRHGGNPQ